MSCALNNHCQHTNHVSCVEIVERECTLHCCTNYAFLPTFFWILVCDYYYSIVILLEELSFYNLWPCVQRCCTCIIPSHYLRIQTYCIFCCMFHSAFLNNHFVHNFHGCLCSCYLICNSQSYVQNCYMNKIS